MAASVGLILQERSGAITLRDSVVAAAASALFLLPASPMSWVAVFVVSLHLLLTSGRQSRLARAAAITLALTIPMFWARLAMSIFTDPILRIDATLVSSVLGTAREGNLVAFADGSGSMFIAPGCSSFTNLSLAFLSTVLLVKGLGRGWSWPLLALGLATSVGVVAINVARISMIGFLPDQFDLIHGEVGATIAAWATTMFVLAMCLMGVHLDARTRSVERNGGLAAGLALAQGVRSTPAAGDGWPTTSR
ncbi:hypothetical protein [Lutibaculum baratangense]|nr:hypothetical protein [Lutibaculum baratangense]